MIGQNLSGLWKRDDRFYLLAGHLILSLMLTCMVASLVQLGGFFLVGFNGAYLVGLAFLISLEALLSRRILKGSSIFDPEWQIFRGTELVVILLAVKLAYYAQHGLGRLLIDASGWWQDFLGTFLTSEYGFACLVIALVWVLSSGLSEDLALLNVDERILRQEAESGIYEERERIREHLVGVLLSIGLVMIVLAALLRSSRVMSWAELPLMRLGVANLLLYFLLFLVLLSLTQFSLMRASWMRDRLSVGRRIERRWQLYSFVLILGLTLVARLLPTGYSFGLLASLNYLISLLIVIIYELMVLLITPFILLIYWLSTLFKTSAEPLPPLQIPAAPPPLAIQPTSTVPALELLKSLLFWAILLGVVGYSLYYYIHERRELLEASRRLPFYPALLRFWRWLAGRLGGMRQGFNAAVETRLERLRRTQPVAPHPRLSGYFSLRRLSPRQRVMFYYLALVRRGDEAGMGRRPSQTPYAYSQTLTKSLDALAQADASRPEIEQSIQELTENFVQARYSARPVTSLDAELAQSCWERIRRLFPRRKGRQPH
jgi:hypothetical protein